ncbi:hypothetical protein Bca101_049013 [Brassica carinata]
MEKAVKTFERVNTSKGGRGIPKDQRPGCFFFCSAISDTCVAMKEWVDHPQAETALSSILPCVDEQTTNQTLTQIKVVINSIVTVVNTFVYAFANTNPSPDRQCLLSAAPSTQTWKIASPRHVLMILGVVELHMREYYIGLLSALERNLRVVIAGLGMISVRVLLCLVLWLFYANRPQREEVFADPHRPQVKDLSSGNGFDNGRPNDETKRYAEVV